MSRTFFSLRRRRGFISRHPAPLTMEDARLVSCPGLFHRSSCIFFSSDDADQFRNASSRTVVWWQPWIYLRLVGPVLFRVIRRGIGISRRLSASGTLCAYRRLGCSPSNPSVSRTNGPPPEEDRR